MSKRDRIATVLTVVAVAFLTAAATLLAVGMGANAATVLGISFIIPGLTAGVGVWLFQPSETPVSTQNVITFSTQGNGEPSGEQEVPVGQIADPLRRGIRTSV
jgi:hypothetical protein